VKKLRKIIFNALTVLSLLLGVATVGLWVRSYRIYSLVAYSTHGVTWGISPQAGKVFMPVFATLPHRQNGSPGGCAVRRCEIAAHLISSSVHFTPITLPLLSVVTTNPLK
jgi:hypothetical protein